MRLPICILFFFGSLMNGMITEATCSHLRRSTDAVELYYRSRRSSIAAKNKRLYRLKVLLPLEDLESHRKSKYETSEWCRVKSDSIGTIEWLHEMVMQNCTIPTKEIQDRVMRMEAALNPIEAHPRWLSYEKGPNERRVHNDYDFVRQWLLQRAAKTTEKDVKDMAAVLEPLIGKTLPDTLPLLVEMLENLPPVPRLPSLRNISLDEAFPGLCIFDGYLADNEYEYEPFYQLLSSFENDVRAAAGFAVSCSQADGVDPARDKAFNDKADAIIRKADGYFEAKMSLVWPGVICQEAGNVYFLDGLGREKRDHADLAGQWATRFSALGPNDHGYAVVVFSSAYNDSKWVSMLSMEDPIDHKNTSFLSKDLFGVNLFVARFQKDQSLVERLKWLNETKTRDRVEQILKKHCDEDAAVLLNRVKKEIPELFDAKNHFSAAILLRNRKAVFLDSSIPHVASAPKVDHRVPYELIHTDSLGFASTQVYLYLFP